MRSKGWTLGSHRCTELTGEPEPNISDANGIGTNVLDNDLDGGFGEPVLRVREVTGTTFDPLILSREPLAKSVFGRVFA